MKNDEIALQLTLKVLERNQNSSSLLTQNSNSNENLANEVAKFYKTIYRAVKETKSKNKDNAATTQYI
ncbi:hypothetical protein [Orenia marismortui]|uniref:Uncharacterized protein n=1 Tax=Orenia marismortui TaxID=46469 RepID=A0A4R8GSZ3_9FIRM|nr:hypothetical protein [Orenia marismortui]TDX49133.1 hypothetical protein C7959_12027 [Orenia marismortui]